MVAAASGRIECCERLVALGADVGAVNADGVGALRHAASRVSRRDRAASRAAARSSALLRAAPSPTLILHHDDCGRHVSFKPHQESPERIGAILERLLLSSCASDDPNAVAARELDLSADFEPRAPPPARRPQRGKSPPSPSSGGTSRTRPWRSRRTTRAGSRACPRGSRRSPSSATRSSPRGRWPPRSEPPAPLCTRWSACSRSKNSAAFACVRPARGTPRGRGRRHRGGAPSSGFSILNNAMIGEWTRRNAFFTTQGRPARGEPARTRDDAEKKKKKRGGRLALRRGRRRETAPARSRASLDRYPSPEHPSNGFLMTGGAEIASPSDRYGPDSVGR